MKKILFLLLISSSAFAQQKFVINPNGVSGGGGSTDTTSLSNRINGKMRVYNVVTQYGADSTFATDATAAIQAAINAAFAAGGGIVYFPNGHYKISGALVTSVNGVNPNCQLYLPLTLLTNAINAPVVKLLGETPPNMFFTALASYPAPVTGVVLESTITGSGTNPSVIGSSYEAMGWGNFNTAQLEIENITIRTNTKSGGTDIAGTMGGINAGTLQLFTANKIRVDINSNLYDCVEPTANITGIILPVISNDATCRVDNALITGFKYGIDVSEHGSGTNISIGVCTNAVRFLASDHGCGFDKMLIHWSKHNILVTGTAHFKIDNLAIENKTFSKWFDNVDDLLISGGGSSQGTIYMNRVVSNTGEVNSGFTWTGTAPNVKVYDLGGTAR